MSKMTRLVAKGMVFVLFVCLFLGISRSEARAETDYYISGDTITITNVPNNDLYPVLKSAVDYAKSNHSYAVTTIRVPAGEYNLSSCIHIYSNIRLELTGVTLNFTAATGNMLLLGTAASNMDMREAGYGTRKNISVIGGTWVGNNSNVSSLIRMAHASNVLFEGCTFSGGGCSHQMEVASIDGFTVKNCTFRDMARVTDEDGKKEALQLDMPCATKVFKNVVLDGTPMTNVEITGCTFQNVPRGVGTHSMLVGTYHTNLEISNNTFKDVDGECIIALNYQDCNIRNNWIENCGAGIVFQSFKPKLNSTFTTTFDGSKPASKPLDHDADTVISGNRIYLDPAKYADEYAAIQVYGYNLETASKSGGQSSKDIIPADNYYISNVNVVGNDIETNGYGIHFSDVRDSSISGNTIVDNDEESGQDGITVDAACENITIHNNEIQDSTRYGIGVTGGSSVTAITGNWISSTNWFGICVEQESCVTDGIDSNVVDNCNDNGIQLDSSSTAGSISHNTVSDCNWHGISIHDNSSVKEGITANTVEDCGVNGIFLNGSCSAGEITDNTLSGNQKYGIALYEDSGLEGDISGNTIQSSKNHAIQLNLNCYVQNITDNQVTDSKGKGIVIETGCTVNKAISSNTINKTKLEGIFVHSTENALEINANTLKNCGRSPIIIDTEPTYKIVVSKNKITTKKGQEALSVTRGKVKSDIKDDKDKKSDKTDKKDDKDKSDKKDDKGTSGKKEGDDKTDSKSK